MNFNASFVSQYKTLWVVLSFLAGLIYDLYSLMGQISNWTIYLLWLYLIVFHGALFLWNDFLGTKVQRILRLIVPFVLGSIYSALSIVYLRSSPVGWMMILSGLLFLGLLLHEFRFHSKRTLNILLIFQLPMAILLLNFLITHGVKELFPSWFWLSFVIALFLHFSLLKVHQRLFPYMWKSLIVSWFLGFCVAVLALTHSLPPVPLLLKDHLATSYKLSGYAGLLSQQTMWDKLCFRPLKIQFDPRDRLWVMASVYSPSQMHSILEHRWSYWDQKRGWIPTDTIVYKQVMGGREKGYRVLSYKDHLHEGLWKVDLALKEGGVLSSEEYDLRQKYPLGKVRVLE